VLDLRLLGLRNDSSEGGRGSRGTANGGNIAGPDDDIVVALGCDVGVRAAGLVVEAVILALEVLDVVVDGLLLVLRCRCDEEISRRQNG